MQYKYNPIWWLRVGLPSRLRYFIREVKDLLDFYFGQYSKYPFFGDEDCEYCYIPVKACGKYESSEDIIKRTIEGFLGFSEGDEEYKIAFEIANNSFKHVYQVSLNSGDDYRLFGRTYSKKEDCYYMSFV